MPFLPSHTSRYLAPWTQKNKNKNICVLTVCLLSFSTHSPTSLKTTSSPSSHLPGSCVRSFGYPFTRARARTQTQADEPSVRQDEPCHEPQTDIMLTLRPSSNHLSPACCATPLDSKLRHTFAIPSRTVFCQHWATLFPLQASSPRRLWNRPRHQMRYITFCTDLSSRIFAAEWESGRVLQRRSLPFISRNLKIYSYFAQECNNTAIFNTNI